MTESRTDVSGVTGRICLLTSNFPRWRGDATTPFVLHLAQDLQALGWEVEVLAPHAPGAARREVLDGILVRRFRYLWPASQQTVCYQGGALINLRKQRTNWLKLPLLIFFEWLALVALLARRRYDLVNAHWVLPQGFVAVTAARIIRVPVVITVHGSDVFGLRAPLFTWFKRVSLEHASAVTVNSSATERAVRDITAKVASLRRIPMGATPQPPVGEPDPKDLRIQFRRGGGPLLIFVGRLVEQKGIFDLIRAVDHLVKRRSEVSLVLLGDGPDRAAVEALCDELGVRERVYFLAWTDPAIVPNYLRAADVFVGPSKRDRDGSVEAQGLAIVEAMLNRAPIVATRSGGIPDLIHHEKTGLLVPEGRPDEIADAVERIVGDPGMARRMKEAAYDLAAAEFTRDRSAGRFSALFSALKDGSQNDATRA